MEKSPGQENREPSQVIREWRLRVEERVAQLLPSEEEAPRELHAAMRYAVFPGGKRFRPLLVMAAAELTGRAAEALDAACAAELVHSYSLVHDDLPCMDDDDLRRGRPTCHRVFGEAVALLAGNALLSLSFEVLSNYPGDLAGRLVRELARASGSRGLAGGQVGDLLWPARAENYLFVVDAKTAALFRSCLRMGGLVARVPEETLALLGECGLHLGRAFQIQDDLDDWRPGHEGAGTSAVSVWGEEAARQRADEETDAAFSAVASLGERAAMLRYVVAQVLRRSGSTI